MTTISWLRQEADKPLFPDILWSRPENRRLAGKLLIAGGSSHGFAAVGGAYAAAARAGVGSCRVLLPDVLQKSVERLLPEASFAPSTKSGGLAKSALADMLDEAGWADGVLLAGDFGRSSETAILLESFLVKYSGGLTLTGDSLDYFLTGELLFDRPDTVIVAGFSQLQRLAAAQPPFIGLKSSMSLHELVGGLNQLTENRQAAIVALHGGYALASYTGRTSTTPLSSAGLTILAAYNSVWRLQQPGRPLEASTTANYDLAFGLKP